MTWNAIDKLYKILRINEVIKQQLKVRQTLLENFLKDLQIDLMSNIESSLWQNVVFWSGQG